MPIRPATSRRTDALRRAVVLGALTFVAACNSEDEGGNSDAFAVRNSAVALASGNSPLVGSGVWLGFLLSEAAQGSGGSDYNQDGDTIDSIVTRINTDTASRAILDVAAQELAFARQTLFMLVSEAADARDWNGDMDVSDRVLLYVRPSESTPTFLDTVSSATSMAAIGGTVVYAAEAAPAGAMETNLRLTTVASNGAAPSAPATILTGSDPNNDGISYRVTGRDGNVVFLRADEAVDGDLNGDGDATDANIFAVLDAGEATPTAINSGLAISAESTPTAVPISGGGEWLVAFLVDEMAEGESLNDPALFALAWAPPNCASADADLDDHVLHWFQLTDLAMGTAAVNTGLIGASTATAYAHREEFVGVVMPESDQGAALCNLNGDGDDSDDVFRWVDASNPAATPLPVTSTSRLIAINGDIPGGSGGVVRLDDAWVIVVDESADGRDWTGDGQQDREVVLAHNPASSGQGWNAQHGSETPTRPIGVSWMSEDPGSGSRMLAGLLEASVTSDLNVDGDQLDAVPTLPEVVTENRLSFPGVGIASAATNAGIVVEQNVGYHRVSEAAQGNLDLNGDGDAIDMVLVRFSLVGAFPSTTMATLNTVTRTAVEFAEGQAEFGAFVCEEAEQGVDFNSDGDTDDFVVRYFELP